MIKCVYCYTDNIDSATQCDFCYAPLTPDRPLFNTPLAKFTEKDIYYADYPTLQKYNHVELLRLLVLTKDKITDLQAEQDIKETAETTKYLIVLAKKVHLIENVIFDKMGRVPKKLGKTEIKRIQDGLRTRIYTHTKNMNLKIPPIYHDYFTNRFTRRY